MNLRLCAAITAVVLASCRRSEPQTDTTSVTSADAAASSAKKTITDADIANAVRSHMAQDAPLRGERIDVAVSHGVATLSGSVGSLRAKERGVTVAELIKGVRAVVNEVKVEPTSRSDVDVASDVRRSLREDATTRPYHVDIAVKDGTVRLTGTLDSWPMKDLVMDATEEVKGVKAIDDHLGVHYPQDRTESQIATDVKARIANDAWLDGAHVNVVVTGTTVRLTGAISSAAQRRRAVRDARVLGVDTADADGLVVDAIAGAEGQQGNVLGSDGEITNAIRDAFRLDPRLKVLEPHASVVAGIATLTGIVADAKSRLAAEADARDTVGVWRVRNEVVVQPGGKPTDADVVRAVQRSLGGDVYIANGKSIEVSIANGKVTLRGAVPSAFDRMNAVNDAEHVPGVAEVDDEIVVLRPPADIRADIEQKLAWDPMAPHGIDVAVGADGVATLTGTANSWSEIKSASRDASSAGASHVIDLLKLKNHPEVVAP